MPASARKNTPDPTYHTSIRWSLAGSVGSGLFQFLQMAVFARLAGPAEAGDYALAAAVTGFLTPVADAGLSQSIIQAKEVKPTHVAALIWIKLSSINRA